MRREKQQRNRSKALQSQTYSFLFSRELPPKAVRQRSPQQANQELTVRLKSKRLVRPRVQAEEHRPQHPVDHIQPLAICFHTWFITSSDLEEVLRISRISSSTKHHPVGVGSVNGTVPCAAKQTSQNN